MSVETPRSDEATDIIAVIEPSAPVFVDVSGRRRKRIRIVFSALGAATLFYGALVATSLAGGPLKPQLLLPFPELVNNLPALDPQNSGSKPGAKNTPAANRPPINSAKKIAGTPAGQTTAVPSGSAPGNGGPGGAATPAVAGTATTPAPKPSASATGSPKATAGPAPTATSSAHPGQTGAAGDTALPGTNQTAASVQSAATVPVGAASIVLPGATLSVDPVAGGSGGIAAGSVALPGVTVILGLA